MLKVLAGLYGLSSRDIAEGSGTGYHRNTISNVWAAGKVNIPKAKQRQVIDYLVSQGVPRALAEKAFDIVSEEQETVRLRKQLYNEEADESPDNKLLTLGVIMLRPVIRRHFGLTGNPFRARQDDQPFKSRSFKLCREAIEAAVEEQALLAIAGRTGCGKSVLWTHLLRQFGGDPNCKVVSVRRFDKGLLRVRDIYLSLLEDLADETPRGGNETTHRRVERLLIEHAEAGVSVMILVNEAHDLSVQALVMLKRLWEGFNDVPKLGYRRAATVILLGQEGLEDMLKQERPELREVSQRTELEKYGELEPDEIGPYLQHRFAHEDNGAFERVFDSGAVKFMGARNIPLTPLLINGIATNAIKTAFQLNDKQVTAEHIQRLI